MSLLDAFAKDATAKVARAARGPIDAERTDIVHGVRVAPP